MLQIKASEALKVEIKGARGFVGEAYLARPGLFSVEGIPAFISYTRLKPGEETEVSVAVPDLAPNADVKSILAKLHVTDTTTGPPPQTGSSVSVKREGDKETKFQISAEPPLRPRNVSLRLEHGEPFWNFNGTLVNASYDLPNFAEAVNAYLDKLQAQGNDVSLKFLVRSDTPGAVRIQITGKEASRLQTQTWPNPLDGTIRLDRNLELAFAKEEELLLDPIQGPANATLKRIRMDIGGNLGPERLFGKVEQHAGHEFASISPDYALAQGFVLSATLECAGVCGMLQTDAPTELYVELQADRNRSPGMEAPLTKANLELSPRRDEVLPAWTYIPFEAAVTLEANTPYWLIFRAATGRAHLGVQAQSETYLGRLLVNRGGKLWKSFGASIPPLASLLRLIYLPGLDNQTAGIQIGVDGSTWQSIDPAAAAQNLSFNVGAPGSTTRQGRIVIQAHARGSLTIANVIQEY